MKKIIKILIVLLTIISIPAIIFYFELSKQHIPNPLLIESSEHIRKTLLGLTPIGTSTTDDVFAVINKHEEWGTNGIQYEYGYQDHFPDGYYRKGEKSIRAKIGEYKKPFDYATAVIVHWMFDIDSRLIDIHVRKDTNGL